MKTAISIPDPIFDAAERLCRRHQIPRSRFYAIAIKQLVDQYRQRDVTAQLNAIYSSAPGSVPPEFHAAQLRTLDEEKW